MTSTLTSHAPAHTSGGGALRRLNFVTALIGGVLFGVLAWWLAHTFLDAGGAGYSDQVTVLTGCGWVVGFLLGIGALTGPGKWFTGRDQSHADEMYLAGKDLGRKRYFQYTTDHKVVGVQYIFATMALLGTGGILAMGIRTNLLTPGNHFVNQQVYNGFLGVHGMLMILGLLSQATL